MVKKVSPSVLACVAILICTGAAHAQIQTVSAEEQLAVYEALGISPFVRPSQVTPCVDELATDGRLPRSCSGTVECASLLATQEIGGVQLDGNRLQLRAHRLISSTESDFAPVSQLDRVFEESRDFYTRIVLQMVGMARSCNDNRFIAHAIPLVANEPDTDTGAEMVSTAPLVAVLASHAQRLRTYDEELRRHLHSLNRLRATAQVRACRDSGVGSDVLTRIEVVASDHTDITATGRALEARIHELAQIMGTAPEVSRATYMRHEAATRSVGDHVARFSRIPARLHNDLVAASLLYEENCVTPPAGADDRQGQNSP